MDVSYRPDGHRSPDEVNFSKSEGLSLVVFILDGNRYALPLESVVRVLQIIEITPLPRAPEIVIGIVDIGGTVLPVVDMRRRLGLPQREIRLSDRLMIARTPHRSVALLVDHSSGVIVSDPSRLVPSEDILPDIDLLVGTTRLDDGMVLIHDLGRLLSLDDEKVLTNAMSEENRI